MKGTWPIGCIGGPGEWIGGFVTQGFKYTKRRFGQHAFDREILASHVRLSSQRSDFRRPNGSLFPGRVGSTALKEPGAIAAAGDPRTVSGASALPDMPVVPELTLGEMQPGIHRALACPVAVTSIGNLVF